jgi:hypothetical protein
MRSLISSFKLLKSLLKPVITTAHCTGTGSFLLSFVLLISITAAAHGQGLSGLKADAIEQGATRSSLSGSGQFSDSNAVAAAPVTDSATILRNAKLIYVRKKSVYFKAQEFENELLKRPEFQRWGMSITRNEADADLIIEVGRKVFTTMFVYTVIDPRTDIIVTSGKLSSLGGTLATKIAKRFIKQVQLVRP